jgi:DNA-binding NarL/FixJ family response regulator
MRVHSKKQPSASIPSPSHPTPSRSGSVNDPPSLSPAQEGPPFRVAVVDDEPDVHESLRFILEEAVEFDTAGFYLCGQEALAGILTQPPDVVLMDIRLPDLSGIECTRRLTAGLPQLRVVMISALDDRRTMEDAIQAGCHGYLTKPFGSSQCLAVLRCALAARLSGAAPARLSENQCPLHRGANVAHCFQITEREVKVLGSLSDGKMYKEIAADLSFSPGLTHKLINRVFRRLRVHSRQELVQRWLICSRCSKWTVRSTRPPRAERGGPRANT